MKHLITLVAVFVLTTVSLNAQTWNLGQQENNFLISLEIGQGNTKWPIVSPGELIAGEKAGDQEIAIPTIYMGSSSNQQFRLNALYRMSRLKVGVGLNRENFSVQRYDSSAGYSGTNLLRFNMWSANAIAEYYLFDLGPLSTSASLSVGTYLTDDTENLNIIDSNLYYTVGVPFEFNFSEKLGLMFQPYYNVRTFAQTDIEIPSASTYGMSAGLRLAF
ncbi:hypothetical protein N8482_02925 [Chitinophagales bacterium]|nr:hypothetical protein [Chitinophagales bacterium]